VLVLGATSKCKKQWQWMVVSVFNSHSKGSLLVAPSFWPSRMLIRLQKRYSLCMVSKRISKILLLLFWVYEVVFGNKDNMVKYSDWVGQKVGFG
jgi:hypothetical protein